MKTIFFVASATLALTISSCKKCHECHYDSPSGEVEIGEYCDDKLEEIEKSGYTVGDSVYTVHCEEH